MVADSVEISEHFIYNCAPSPGTSHSSPHIC